MSPTVFTALLLSAPIGGYASPEFVWGLAFVLVAVAVAAWRAGFHLIRRKQRKVLVVTGALLLALAFIVSLQILEFIVMVLFQ